MSGLLLDTHAVLWAFDRPELLSSTARAAIEDEGARVLVSAASVYELTFKHRLGKLDEAGQLLAEFPDWMGANSFDRLDVTHEHAAMAGRLDPRHRDPFDRLLIAQALVEDVAIVSNEKLFTMFGVRRLW